MDMPKISIIVPVYNVEDYLAECLDSIIAQTLKDIEIICVNDGSEDGSDIILQAYRQRDSRIKVIKQENGGLSAARNTGMREATGKYIAFVDSDDAIASDALEILWKNAEKNNSDIVVFGFNPRYFNTREHIDKWLYTANPTRNIVFNEYSPDVLFKETGSHPFVWRNLYKRDFIEKNQLQFSVGIFGEDTIFQFQAFPHAKNISFIKDKLYYYRSVRPKSLMSDYSKKIVQKALQHIVIIREILDDWKNKGLYTDAKRQFIYWSIDFFNNQFVKTSTDDRGLLAEKFISLFDEFDCNLEDLSKKRRNMVIDYMLWARRPTEMAEVYKKSNSTQKKKYNRLLESEGLKSIASQGKKTVPETWWEENTRIYDSYYNYDIEEQTVYIDAMYGLTFTGNMLRIAQELSSGEYGKFDIYVFLFEDAVEDAKEICKRYNINVKEFISNEIDATCVMERAKYIFTDAVFRWRYVKRPGQIVVNTWHGTPLKKMGRQNYSERLDLNLIQHAMLSSDYLVYPNEFTRDRMLDDYMVRNIYSGKVIMEGYPRNSAFFDDKKCAAVKTELGLDGKQIFAYMPTWRESNSEEEANDQVETVLGFLTEIDRRLEANQVLLVKLHHFVHDRLDCSQFDHIKEFDKRYETYDVLNAADCLISDYSSVFFDFASTGKKIILFAYDEEKYLGERGTYFPISDLPFPVVRNVDELLNEMNQSKDYDDSGFINKYCKFDNAETTKRLCRYLFKGVPALILGINSITT